MKSKSVKMLVMEEELALKEYVVVILVTKEKAVMKKL